MGLVDVEISEDAKNTVKEMVEASPAMDAFQRGVIVCGDLLKDWDGGSWPPEPEVPFSHMTQDGLCRAFIAGVLFCQAMEIEGRLLEQGKGK